MPSATATAGAGWPFAFSLSLDRESATPLYRQIAATLERAIATGEIPVGARLPPERTLAVALGIDRTTVIAAYRELAAAGLIEARVGRGTTVVRPPAAPDAAAPVPVDWARLLTPTVTEDPLLDELGALGARPDVISLAAGVPAPEFYPIATFRALLNEALGSRGEGLLQYCPPEGLDALRAAIASRLHAAGAISSPDRILICAGSQQGLYLLSRALIEPGDTVVVEAPTYHGAILVFRAAGATIVPVPADKHGMDVDRLADLLSRRPVKLIYTLPTFQNPTGATLPLDRRQRLLALARRHGVPIIEDDPYGALRYDGEAMPSLLALDRAAAPNVIYLSTFSKMLFPGFRLGWIAAPPPVVSRLAWLKSLVDLDSNPVAQWAIAAYIDRGALDQHLAELRTVYPARRDALMAALRASAGGGLSLQRPDGGFYLWARLAAGLRAREVLTEAIGQGVAFVPGDLYHVDGGGRDTMRLAFSSLPPEQLALAGHRLGAAIATVAARRGHVATASAGGRII